MNGHAVLYVRLGRHYIQYMIMILVLRTGGGDASPVPMDVQAAVSWLIYIYSIHNTMMTTYPIKTTFPNFWSVEIDLSVYLSISFPLSTIF